MVLSGEVRLNYYYYLNYSRHFFIIEYILSGNPRSWLSGWEGGSRRSHQCPDMFHLCEFSRPLWWNCRVIRGVYKLRIRIASSKCYRYLRLQPAGNLAKEHHAAGRKMKICKEKKSSVLGNDHDEFYESVVHTVGSRFAWSDLQGGTRHRIHRSAVAHELMARFALEVSQPQRRIA